jgi:hypothetical protein
MTTTKDAGKVKGKAVNDFNLAAMGKKKTDKVGSPDPNKPVTPPGRSRGNGVPMNVIKQKSPGPGR